MKRVDKVKLLHDCLIIKFQARFYPGQELTVDETMVGFRGRFDAKTVYATEAGEIGDKVFHTCRQLHWICTQYFCVHWC